MLQHIRHQLRSIGYNRGAFLRPRKAATLAGAWYRNQAAYFNRTRTVARVLGVDAATVGGLLDEAGEAMAHCAERSRGFPDILPGLWNPSFGPVLYAVVRATRPEIMVETGVGSGVSSTFILSAMERNGMGSLHSVDLPSDDGRLLPEDKRPGWIVPERLRDGWELIAGDARAELPPLLERLGALDAFLHDSDHGYDHMAWELWQAHDAVRSGGVVLADDVAGNRAWDDFASGAPGRSGRINRTGLYRKP